MVEGLACFRIGIRQRIVRGTCQVPLFVFVIPHPLAPSPNRVKISVEKYLFGEGVRI
jgi:hypothetical protein